MGGRYRSVVGGIALLALWVAPAAQAEEIVIAGSTTVSSTVLQPYEAKVEERAGVDIRVNAIGSSRGIMALAQGNAALAAISAPLADVVRKINAKQPGSIDGRKLVAHKVGETKVAFITHPDNPVKELTLAQITDILAGRIKFWSELGGLGTRIEIITEYKGGGIRTLVEETIGKWGDVMTEVSSVQTGPQVVFAVSRVPNALGVASAAMVDGTVHILRSDEAIVQPMYLVTRGQPDKRLSKLIEAVRNMAGGLTGGV